ncbi:hypothetical protein EDD85DRAFT_981570 [Armillaria nabsnona]|nr:hypothetical protein EDD85DRAFT_981570 [Armillaria nabsnona]
MPFALLRHALRPASAPNKTLFKAADRQNDWSWLEFSFNRIRRTTVEDILAGKKPSLVVTSSLLCVPSSVDFDFELAVVGAEATRCFLPLKVCWKSTLSQRLDGAEAIKDGDDVSPTARPGCMALKAEPGEQEDKGSEFEYGRGAGMASRDPSWHCLADPVAEVFQLDSRLHMGEYDAVSGVVPSGLWFYSDYGFKHWPCTCLETEQKQRWALNTLASSPALRLVVLELAGHGLRRGVTTASDFHCIDRHCNGRNSFAPGTNSMKALERENPVRDQYGDRGTNVGYGEKGAPLWNDADGSLRRATEITFYAIPHFHYMSINISCAKSCYDQGTLNKSWLRRGRSLKIVHCNDPLVSADPQYRPLVFSGENIMGRQLPSLSTVGAVLL